MLKKITSMFLVILALLICKVDAATLTQKVGERFITQTITEGQQVRLRFINQKEISNKREDIFYDAE